MNRITAVLTGLVAFSGVAGFSGSASAFVVDFGAIPTPPITSSPANNLLTATSVSVPSWTSDLATVTALTISNPIDLAIGATIDISFDIGGIPYTDTTTVDNVTRTVIGHEVTVTSAGDLVGDSLLPNVSELDFTFNQSGGAGKDITGSGTYTTSASIVPESSTWAMLVVGFVGLGYAAFRRSSKDRALAV